MAHQMRDFVVRLATNVKVYQLVALGMALSGIIVPLMSGGGGGSGA